MNDITEENKAIARMALEAFGGTLNVACYWDEAENNSVDLLACKDRPEKGVTSYSTIGLSDSPILVGGDEIGVRLELVGACSSLVKEFPNIITTAAFCIINSKWSCSPGAVFPEVVEMYNCSKTMKHLLFVPPFLWDEKLKTIDFSSKTVAWLLAVPISEEEYKFAEEESSDKLEDLFEENQIDLFNINRPSVV